MRRLLKDIWFVITGRIDRPRNKCFKPGFGQWDGAVIKQPSIVYRIVYRLRGIPRRIESVKNRKFIREQYEQKEWLIISSKFPFLPVKPKFNNDDFGIVTLDTNLD